MKRHQFRQGELSKEAFEIYSNSSYVFAAVNEEFYVSDSASFTPRDTWRLGTTENVEAFLLDLGKDSDEE